MSKADYTGIDLARQSNYVIAISPKNERSAFETSLSIAKEYIKKVGPPKVIILTDGYKPDELKSIPFGQVQTFKTGTIRLADRSSEESNLKVIEKVSSLMKNSMIVIDDSFKYDDEIAINLLAVKGKAQDCTIHRTEIKLLDSEIDYIRNVYKQIEEHDGNGSFIPEKNIILRLHDYESFPFTAETLGILIEHFGDLHGWNIFSSYYVARKKTVLFQQKVMQICKNNDESPVDFINPREFRKQIKNYTYYNLITGRIVEKDEAFVAQCANELANILQKAQQN